MGLQVLCTPRPVVGPGGRSRHGCAVPTAALALTLASPGSREPAPGSLGQSAASAGHASLLIDLEPACVMPCRMCSATSLSHVPTLAAPFQLVACITRFASSAERSATIISVRETCSRILKSALNSCTCHSCTGAVSAAHCLTAARPVGRLVVPRADVNAAGRRAAGRRAPAWRNAASTHILGLPAQLDGEHRGGALGTQRALGGGRGDNARY